MFVFRSLDTVYEYMYNLMCTRTRAAVLANKQDLPNAVSVPEVIKSLGLDEAGVQQSEIKIGFTVFMKAGGKHILQYALEECIVKVIYDYLPGVDEDELEPNRQRIKGRTWFVQSCTATTSGGVFEGLGWLSQQISDNTRNT